MPEAVIVIVTNPAFLAVIPFLVTSTIEGLLELKEMLVLALAIDSEDKLNKVLNYEDIQSRQIQFNIDYNNRF